MKSSAALDFLKNYYLDIKQIREKFKGVWISKSHLFKKTFLKLNLQKYSNFTANVARFLSVSDYAL